MHNTVDISTLKGLTITSISGANIDSCSVVIKTLEGNSFEMMHSQDCCEHVSVHSVLGDVQSIIGSPVILVGEGDEPTELNLEYEPDSHTWTIYRIETKRGYLQINWLGVSNGYYGETVDFIQIS